MKSHPNGSPTSSPPSSENPPSSGLVAGGVTPHPWAFRGAVAAYGLNLAWLIYVAVSLWLD